MSLTPSLPTLYEYYTSSGITTGLSADQTYFTLNDKNVTLYSGAMHYFRVPRQYWRDRLRKMRAAGLNTVETYVPWNLHEPENGRFDFGAGGSDFEDFLHLEEFLKLAQEEDLLAIVRPGPYICAEWDFGGLPSWLLKEEVKVRTSDHKFMKYVGRYFSVLLKVLALLQFTKGGPIVGVQIENEYGSTRAPDKKYLEGLVELMRVNNVTELLFTSDGVSQFGDVGTLPGLFKTANFARNARKEFDVLKKLQEDKPMMAMEYWTGWFDHWGEKHHVRNNTEFRQVLEEILAYPASVNMYMFHGGTNWGFLNGANIPNSGREIYQPDTTSYDYDAPLAENGDYTEKYFIVKELIEKYSTIKTRVPEMPLLKKRRKFETITVSQQLQFEDLLQQAKTFSLEEIVPMELLPEGQSFGYIVYSTIIDIPKDSVLKIEGFIHDSALILVGGVLESPPLQRAQDFDKFGYWRLKDGTFDLPEGQQCALDIVVENWGRNNYGKLEQFKGLKGAVSLNNVDVKNWTIKSLDFKTNWTKSLTQWNNYERTNLTLSKATLDINFEADTYIDMSKWNTGIVIVNNFVLGRYMRVGPQHSLYLPGVLLKKGKNEILVFEHFEANDKIEFSNNPIYS